MKPILLKAALASATFLLYSAGVKAQSNSNQNQADTLQNGLDLKIEITSNNLNLRGATVKIYQDNKFITALNNKLQPDMDIKLEKNTYYVMEVDKPGYASKSILISTVVPGGSDNTKYEHDISISLDKKAVAKNNSVDPLIGILYYDPQKDVYVGCTMVNDAPNKEAIIGQLENWLDL